jgi:hypothetical protein
MIGAQCHALPSLLCPPTTLWLSPGTSLDPSPFLHRAQNGQPNIPP